ncbi:MAG: XTP/dITP diphosphatase [Thermodesulfobacteriota bacterium]
MHSSLQLVLASRNQGKIQEIKAILQGVKPGIQVLGLDSFPALGSIPEPGSTFQENALHKARLVAEKTGLLSLADDSGLEVDALQGAPGVYSARYSGPNAPDQKNNQKLLQELQSVPLQQRSARFVCVLAICAPGGEYSLSQGTWEGRITMQPRGDKGFGYDPLFEDPNLGKTAAELEPEEKNRLSHRAQALEDFAKKLPGFLQKLQLAD